MTREDEERQPACQPSMCTARSRPYSSRWRLCGLQLLALPRDRGRCSRCSRPYRARCKSCKSLKGSGTSSMTISSWSTSKLRRGCATVRRARTPFCRPRSEEHTSELQSRGHLVCRLLLEKKKKAKLIAALAAKAILIAHP